jgi:hypothetical protein
MGISTSFNVIHALSNTEVSYADATFWMLVIGGIGPNYAIEFSTNLSNWTEVFTTNSPTLPFGWADPNASGSPERFYRVRSRR